MGTRIQGVTGRSGAVTILFSQASRRAAARLPLDPWCLFHGHPIVAQQGQRQGLGDELTGHQGLGGQGLFAPEARLATLHLRACRAYWFFVVRVLDCRGQGGRR